MTDDKINVLFICTHNSARSQMAEGFIRTLCGDRYKAFSAGTEPGEINPYAVMVMKEIGIDISKQYSKSFKIFIEEEFDYIVTVCDHAKESCPFFPGGKLYIHQNFTDPSGFTGSDEEILKEMRNVRDEIKRWINTTFCRS